MLWYLLDIVKINDYQTVLMFCILIIRNPFLQATKIWSDFFMILDLEMKVCKISMNLLAFQSLWSMKKLVKFGRPTDIFLCTETQHHKPQPYRFMDTIWVFAQIWMTVIGSKVTNLTTLASLCTLFRKEPFTFIKSLNNHITIFQQ